MNKWKTLIALLCIFGNALSQDDDEWSQEYNDYAGHFDELFKIPVDDEYDDIIKKIKHARDNHFEPEADNYDLGQFGDEVHELIKSSSEYENNNPFYDTLVNDNGEIYNGDLQGQYSAEEFKESTEIESNEESKIYYDKDQYEDTVNDENINGNAQANDYDPEEFDEGSKDDRLPSDSKEEGVQRENESEHKLEKANIQRIYQSNVPRDIAEENKQLFEEDRGMRGDRLNEPKVPKTNDNTENINNTLSSNIHQNINGNFQARNSKDTSQNYNNDNNDESGRDNTSNESKLAHDENDSTDTDDKINVNLGPNKDGILRQENKSEDEGYDGVSSSEALLNEGDDIENFYDDINEDVHNLMEIVKKIGHDDNANEDETQKFYDSKNTKNKEDSVDTGTAIDNVVIAKPFTCDDEKNSAEEKSSELVSNFNFNDINNNGNNNYVSANDINDITRNQLKDDEDIADDGAIDNIEIDQSIPSLDDNIEAEERNADEKLLTHVEKIQNYDGNQRVNSDVANDNDRKKYVHDKLSDDAESASETKQNDVDGTEQESKFSIEDLNYEIGKFIDEHNNEILNNMKTLQISPINIKLSLNKTVIVASPNYPEPYPGNNVIDWYFDGEGGTGIELNITNFAVDGNSGDYLLIKPGQTDTSGSSGIIFTYLLKQERRYRFMDVENMFVRFESKGSNYQKFEGFQFSVKFLKPKVEYIVGIDPEPEAVVRTPEQTHTVHLAGFTLHETGKVEAFRDILVDMATMYINAKWPQCLQPSLSEAVQLTRLTPCNLAWPLTDGCTSITFGIPLPEEDCWETYRLTTKQMDDMWTTYSHADPFATRMRILGISEFKSPNDRAVLTVWWAWTFGAVLLVCAVALSVHRLNCLNEYNGMRRLHEDTDSAGSGRKSDLSLYPTPHQTLPPMFADGKFDHYLDGNYAPDSTTRVDLGGAFNNKGFVRDGELMDLNSDEEIIMSLPDEAESNTRSSYSSGIRPRDVYGV